MFILSRIHFNIIIPSIQRTESGLFSRHLLKILYAFLISSTFTTRLAISALQIHSFITLNRNCKSFIHSACNFLPVSRCSSFIKPIQHFVPKHLQNCIILSEWNMFSTHIKEWVQLQYYAC